MKQIKLTQGKVALVDESDFNYINQWKWYVNKLGNTYYALRVDYANGRLNGIPVYMSRLILCINDSKIHVDHKDGNGLNNQKSNLRIATRSQNKANSIKQKNCTSEYKGVSLFKDRNKWRCQIVVNKKRIHIGLFDFEHEAAIAYDIAAKQYFGEFARLNFV